MEKKKTRELLPDVLRGFAIFLVVLGHCIQEGSGTEFKWNAMYFQDKCYQFIYSFHMPLFMMISGYFAWDSMKKAESKQDQCKLLVKRSAVLLIPILGWTCYDYVRLLLKNGLTYPAFQSTITFIKSFLMSMLTNAWFLWAVFWCFFIVFLMHFYLRDSVVLYLIGFLAMFFIPDGMGLGAYKYMLPYFISAFYYRMWKTTENKEYTSRNKYIEKLMTISDVTWMILLGVLFGVLFMLFDENSFIYLSGYKLIGKNMLKQLGIDFYRMLIGFVGAGFFILLWKRIVRCAPRYTFPILSALGKNSLGIYIISGYLILQAGVSVWNDCSPNYLMNLLQAYTVTALAFGLTVILKRIPFLKHLVG